MIEQTRSEAAEGIAKAVNEVTRMYLDDQLGDVLYNESTEQRNRRWRDVASGCNPFSQKVIDLREALNVGVATKKAFLESITRTVFSYFSAVGNEDGRQLLTELLFARVSKRPGYIDYGTDILVEAKSMAAEMNGECDLRSEAMKKLDLDEIVKKVLAGDLKLTRQT